MKVLVIEDNEILSRNIVRYLASREIFAEASLDWEEWLYKALTKHFDIIILDINLPKKDWIEICKTLREKWKEVSIIMLTSRWTNDDIVTGLDIWADDYLVKPFEYSELLARINAIYRRRMQNQSNTIISFDNIEINLKTIEVKQKWEIKGFKQGRYLRGCLVRTWQWFRLWKNNWCLYRIFEKKAWERAYWNCKVILIYNKIKWKRKN